MIPWRWQFAALLASATPAAGQAPSGAIAVDRQAAAEALQQCLARGIDPFHDDACYNRHIEQQEARLVRAVVAARDYIAHHEREASDPQSGAMPDIRRDPAYLDRSQAAWREFVDQDCTMRAGLLGGANIWVSRGIRSCVLEELDRRIAFLESIATGAFTAP